jgi:Tfp pilus assembly protein PilF
MDRSKDIWRTLVVCSFLAAVTLVVFWPARHFNFLNWDDLTYLEKNDHVRAGLTWDDLRWSFTHSYCSNWHPVTWLSHMSDCQLYGLNPGGHHLTNLLLHSANASLLFVALKRLTGAFWRSALVAALFALHPLRVESVAWVAERKDVLSAFFFMLTLWAYARYAGQESLKSDYAPPAAAPGSTFDARRSMFDVQSSPSSSGAARRFWYWTAVLVFTLGLMSKPMLVTLPFVLLLLDYWPLGRFPLSTQNSKLRTSAPVILEKAPFFALSAASCVVTFLTQEKGGAMTSFAMLPLEARLANAVVAYGQYLVKLFWPFNLSPIYPHPDSWDAWLVTGAASALVLPTTAVWLGRRRFPYALMGWLWFLGMLVPVIGIVQVGNQAFADRYTYLPVVGIMVGLVWLGAESIGRGVGPALLPLAVLATLSCCTRAQLPIWKDTGTLFGRAVALAPTNVQALYGLGAHLVDTGRLEEGTRLLEDAIHLCPAFPEALATLAGTLERQQKYEEAIRFYRAGLKAQPNQEGILNNSAWLLATCPEAAFRNGPEAVRLATRACELSGYAKPLLIGTLAAAQAEAGDYQAAIATAERAAALATTLGQEKVVARNQELIQLYRQGQPFHEKRDATTEGHR